VESLARGIEVVKANQRKVLDLLTLLLKKQCSTPTGFIFHYGIVSAAYEDFTGCEELDKATQSSKYCIKNGKFKTFF
jgi:hypothetical protein